MNGSSAERTNSEKERDWRIDRVFLQFHRNNIPNPEDFRGAEGYSDEEIDEKKKKMENYRSVFQRESEERQDELDENDEKRAKLSTVIRLMVADNGGKGLLSDQNTYVDMVSRYDQLYNGTTMMCHMEDLDGGRPCNVSLDITTVSANRNIEGMFGEKSKTKGVMKEISFIKHGQQKKKEKNVPSYVVGVSESRLEDALNGFSVESFKDSTGAVSTELKNEGINQDVKFELLSEMLEQTEMRIGQLGGGDPGQKTKYVSIRSKLRNEIALMLDLNAKAIDNGDKLVYFTEQFEKRYREKMRDLRKEDKVYDEIIRMSNNIKTGSKANSMVRDEKRMGDTLVRPARPITRGMYA